MLNENDYNINEVKPGFYLLTHVFNKPSIIESRPPGKSTQPQRFLYNTVF